MKPDSLTNSVMFVFTHVARPDILSHYFKYPNVVDLHNQARQFDLALEKKWVTHSGYFCLYTTMLGMAVVDTWKLKKRQGEIPISTFRR